MSLNYSDILTLTGLSTLSGQDIFNNLSECEAPDRVNFLCFNDIGFAPRQGCSNAAKGNPAVLLDAAMLQRLIQLSGLLTQTQ